MGSIYRLAGKPDTPVAAHNWLTRARLPIIAALVIGCWGTPLLLAVGVMAIIGMIV